MSNEKFNEFENENNEKLTVEELRNIKGFEHVTNEESFVIIEFVYKIAQMLYNNEF